MKKKEAKLTEFFHKREGIVDRYWKFENDKDWKVDGDYPIVFWTVSDEKIPGTDFPIIKPIIKKR